MIDTIKAWQCIGCGSVEAPQTCIGVCQHRKVEFVYAFEHAEVLRQLAEVGAQRDALAGLLRRFVSVRPRDGAWAAALTRFQDEARRALAGLAPTRASSAGTR